MTLFRKSAGCAENGNSFGCYLVEFYWIAIAVRLLSDEKATGGFGETVFSAYLCTVDRERRGAVREGRRLRNRSGRDDRKPFAAKRYIAGWSSWQLVGLITQRSEVRVLPPLLKRTIPRMVLFFVICPCARNSSADDSVRKRYGLSLFLSVTK